MLSRCNVFSISMFPYVSCTERFLVCISSRTENLYLVTRGSHSATTWVYDEAWNNWMAARSEVSLLQHLSERWDRMITDYYIDRWIGCGTKRGTAALSSHGIFGCTEDFVVWLCIVVPFKQIIFLQVRQLMTESIDVIRDTPQESVLYKQSRWYFDVRNFISHHRMTGIAVEKTDVASSPPWSWLSSLVTTGFKEPW